MAGQVDMLRTTSPVRLALLRAGSAWLFVAAPAALLLALLTNGGVAGGLAWQAGAWLVLAGHAGLGVGAASLAESWGARRDRPTGAALLAAATTLGLLLVGVVHAVWIAQLLRTGSPEQSWCDLQPLLARIGAQPGETAALGAVVASSLAVSWSLPVGVITLERLRPGPVPPLVAVSGVITFGATTVALLALSLAYFVANLMDERLGASVDP